MSIHPTCDAKLNTLVCISSISVGVGEIYRFNYIITVCSIGSSLSCRVGYYRFICKAQLGSDYKSVSQVLK